MKIVKTISRNSVIWWLVALVLTLSVVSFYNYNIQKNLLLKQMQSDSKDIVSSIVAAIKRFKDIKSTMNIQRLVNDMSLELDIFEFRYLEPDGVISNSMFHDEIGKIHMGDSFKKTMQGDLPFGEFFFEIRDYVPVMAIYYPIRLNNEIVGIVDLAVEVSNEAFDDNSIEGKIIFYRKVDIGNLLKAIEGSIKNSISIFRNTNIEDFLYKYVNSTENIIQITVVDRNGAVIASSNKNLVGKIVDLKNYKSRNIVELDGKPVYRMIADGSVFSKNNDEQLILLIDATPYKNNENVLLKTALTASTIALFIALFIARAIYMSAVNRSKEEKERLEKLVKERTKEIELLSKTDSLTGLWNRRYLEEMLEIEFKRAKRYNHDISIAVVDLDHFKNINDTYGHIVGDEVLKKVSQIIKSCIRETDFVARYGGEEIVVILPETDIKTAFTIAKKIKNSIEENPVKFKNKTIKITSSIGLSCLREEHRGHKEVFVEADEALYIAKESGRNRVEVFLKNQSRFQG